MMYLTHKLEEYFYIFHLVKIKEHLQWLLGGQYRNEPARAGLQSQTNDVDSRYRGCNKFCVTAYHKLLY